MNPRRMPKDRMVRMLILSMAFFLSGLAFFAFRMFDTPAGEEKKFSFDTNPSIGQEAEPLPIFAGYPEPQIFHQFTYARGMELPVDGVCKDEFYVLMVFHADIDYRVSPLDARFNTAFPCESEEFSTSIPINTLFLREGERYYVIKAHQGTQGIWYDPY